MKKVTFIAILILILATSLVKNSTKAIEDQIFLVNGNMRYLKSKLGDVLLEYNYLSTPDKLTQYQSQFFEKDLVRIDITKIKKITKRNNQIIISDFLEKTNDE
jgi:hypothetical protein|tara:strand:+ start:249 stop:557 length:309 start_codon:yes stop_codon:yes gene_type:complete